MTHVNILRKGKNTDVINFECFDHIKIIMPWNVLPSLKDNPRGSLQWKFEYILPIYWLIGF